MITPGYSITASSYVLPRLALDFTSAVTDARVVTARAANTATRTNSSGAIEIVNANLARYDFDPTTLICKGQLVEEARTNLFLNSLIDGTSLSTQNVTLAASAYTMSFYGTGSIVISGGHSATVAGTGAYPSRKTYTFTPTAGSSTFTVSGTVQYAQIELGSFATSFIPTAGVSVLRNADDVSMTGTNFSSWYNQSAGTLVARFAPLIANFAANRYPVAISAGASTNAFAIRMSSGAFLGYCLTAGVNQYFNSAGTASAGVYAICGLSLDSTGGVFSANATLSTPVSSATLPTVDRLALGNFTGGAQGAYHIAQIKYYPQRLINRETQAFTK